MRSGRDRFVAAGIGFREASSRGEFSDRLLVLFFDLVRGSSAFCECGRLGSQFWTGRSLPDSTPKNEVAIINAIKFIIRFLEGLGVSM